MIDFLIFLLGVHLCTRLIAACYGIVDLWYCREQYWDRMLGKILLWFTIIGAVGFLTAPMHHAAFIAGLACFAIFHIVVYWVAQLLSRLI
jgi:hypothetical protein